MQVSYHLVFLRNLSLLVFASTASYTDVDTTASFTDVDTSRRHLMHIYMKLSYIKHKRGRKKRVRPSLFSLGVPGLSTQPLVDSRGLDELIIL